MVMASLNGPRQGETPRVDVIYYPEHAKLRVTITGDPNTAASLTRLVNTLLEG